MEGSLPSSNSFRIRGLSVGLNRGQIVTILKGLWADENPHLKVNVRSLAQHPTRSKESVSTVQFDPVPNILQRRDDVEFEYEEPEGGTEPASSETKILTIDSHFRGFTPVHSVPDKQSRLDLIAITGLGGHAFGSFKEKGGNGYMWIRDSLPDFLPTARIFLYGYDSKVHDSASFQNVRHLGAAFKESTNQVTSKPGAGSGRSLGYSLETPVRNPIILLGHSLGGIVIKEMIVQLSKANKSHEGLIDAIHGLLFFGTPSRGMRIESLRAMAADGPNRGLLESLSTESDVLPLLAENFNIAFNRDDTEVASFYETLKSPTAKLSQEGVWTMGGPLDILVSSDSASHTRHANRSFRDISHPLSRTHSGLVKFRRQDEDGDFVLKYLQDMGNRAIAKQSKKAPKVPQLSKEQEECLRSIAFLNRREGRVAPGLEGTCEWLLQHTAFQEWRRRPCALLYIRGDPGSGKSTVIKSAIKNSSDMQDVVTLNFFFDASGAPEEKIAAGMNRYLLHRLAKTVPAMSEELFTKYDERSKSIGPYREQWTWDESELEELFRVSLLRAAADHMVEVFIDALDEAGEYQAIEIARNLQRLVQSAESKSLSLRICFTCRHHPQLPTIEKLKLHVEDHNQQDIRLYVAVSLEEHSAVVQEDKAPAILEALVRRAAGSFRWASLVLERVLDDLRRGKSMQTVLASIQKQPLKLIDLYATTLEDMPDSSRPACISLFDWVCYAQTPLTGEELRHALAMESLEDTVIVDDLKESEWWDADIRKLILNLSKGLIKADDHASSDGYYYVRVSHESVRDFYFARASSLWNRDGDTQPTTAESADFRIVSTCLRYLNLKGIFDWVHQNAGVEKAHLRVRTEVTAEHTLLGYLIDFWIQHLGSITSRDRISAVIDLLDWPHETFWQRWHVWVRLMIWLRGGAPRDGGGKFLHAMATYASTPLFIALCEARSDGVDVGDYAGRTPLSYAAETGKTDTVDYLLRLTNQQGAKMILPDSQDQFQTTPLMFASYYGHFDIVALLLQQARTVRADGRDSLGQTPLIKATIGGHLEIVKQLLKTGKTDPDAKDNSAYTPLAWASECGHATVVKVLLQQKDVDPDSHDQNNETPLIKAARHGRLDVVKLLLSSGRIDPLWTSKSGRTALLAAAEDGQLPVVRHLLQSDSGKTIARDIGTSKAIVFAALYNYNAILRELLELREVNVNIMSARARSPLMMAASNGNLQAVRMLLENPRIIPDLKEEESGLTAFAIASQYNHLEIARALVETGQVDINAVGLDGEGQLHSAARTGALELARIILESPGAVVDLRDSWSRTPLSYAAEAGHLEVLTMLLEKGAAPNASGFGERTPFWRAMRNGHAQVTAVLLQTGCIDADEQDEEGRTFLSLTAEWGYHKIAHYLLSTQNVDINRQDKKGRVPLWYAANAGRIEVVRILLDSESIHPDIEDSVGRTPLGCAASHGHVEIVKALIGTGRVKLDNRDHQQRTALSRAAQSGFTDVVQTLLSTGQVDTNAVDSSGNSAVSWAAKASNAAILEMLLQVEGTLPDHANLAGRTPLSLAAEAVEADAVRILLADGRVQPDSLDFSGSTPLLYAAESGSSEAIKILAETGQVEVDRRNIEGHSVLYLATRAGNVAAVEALLQSGKVEVDIQDNDGCSPLYWAARHGQTEILKMLIDTRQVEVDVEDPDGRTAIWWAAKEGHLSIVRALLAAGSWAVDVADSSGRTPLSVAVDAGDILVVRALLATGVVDVSRADADGVTPLLYAERKNHLRLKAILERALKEQTPAVGTEEMDIDPSLAVIGRHIPS